MRRTFLAAGWLMLLPCAPLHAAAASLPPEVYAQHVSNYGHLDEPHKIPAEGVFVTRCTAMANALEYFNARARATSGPDHEKWDGLADQTESRLRKCLPRLRELGPSPALIALIQRVERLTSPTYSVTPGNNAGGTQGMAALPGGVKVGPGRSHRTTDAYLISVSGSDYFIQSTRAPEAVTRIPSSMIEALGGYGRTSGQSVRLSADSEPVAAPLQSLMDAALGLITMDDSEAGELLGYVDPAHARALIDLTDGLVQAKGYDTRIDLKAKIDARISQLSQHSAGASFDATALLTQATSASLDANKRWLRTYALQVSRPKGQKFDLRLKSGDYPGAEFDRIDPDTGRPIFQLGNGTSIPLMIRSDRLEALRRRP
jgi:hypothetical protein